MKILIWISTSYSLIFWKDIHILKYFQTKLIFNSLFLCTHFSFYLYVYFVIIFCTLRKTIQFVESSVILKGVKVSLFQNILFLLQKEEKCSENAQYVWKTRNCLSFHVEIAMLFVLCASGGFRPATRIFHALCVNAKWPFLSMVSILCRLIDRPLPCLHILSIITGLCQVKPFTSDLIIVTGIRS